MTDSPDGETEQNLGPPPAAVFGYRVFVMMILGALAMIFLFAIEVIF